MATGWIKVRAVLAEDPDVMRIAKATELGEDTVVGKLLRIWGWFDTHTHDGVAHTVTVTWLDRYAGVTGFAAAMMSVGWLESLEDGLAIPNFDTYLSEPSKERSKNAIRQDRHRAKKAETAKQAAKTVTSNAGDVTSNATASVTGNVTPVTGKTLPEKSREEKSREEVKKEEAQRSTGSGEATSGFASLAEKWNAIDGVVPSRGSSQKRLAAYRARCSEKGWLDQVDAALAKVAVAEFGRGQGSGWRMDLEFFLRPDTLLKIIEGKYDDGPTKDTRGAFRQPDNPARVR